MYKRDDIERVVDEFQHRNKPDDRYASFDYCYRHFYPSTKRNLLGDVEKSCLVIGFYLASWGMFRGSSFLLNKSARFYKPLVEYIEKVPAEMWDIDVNEYNSDKQIILLKTYTQIKKIIAGNGNADLTLVTKIMLGVFGNIPAFDSNFGNSFREIFNGACGFRRVNKKSLDCIHEFYKQNQTVIDMLASTCFLTDFSTGEKTHITYPRAKIIDMYGFAKGLGL